MHFFLPRNSSFFCFLGEWRPVEQASTALLAPLCVQVGFCVATQTLAAVFFTFAGAFQMAVWAAGKHARLRKVLGGGWDVCAAGRVLLRVVTRGTRSLWPPTRGGMPRRRSCCNILHARMLVCRFLTARMGVRSTPGDGSCSHPSSERLPCPEHVVEDGAEGIALAAAHPRQRGTIAPMGLSCGVVLTAAIAWI